MPIQFPGHGCMDNLTTERSFDLQATWFIGVDTLSMGVCTTRHWQTYGRLVQEVLVCTVWKGSCRRYEINVLFLYVLMIDYG